MKANRADAMRGLLDADAVAVADRVARAIWRLVRAALAGEVLFVIGMDEPAIAVAAFDPPLIPRDLKPDARMAQSPFATITGNAVGVYNLGLWRGLAHGIVLDMGAGTLRLCPNPPRTARPSCRPAPIRVAICRKRFTRPHQAVKRPQRKKAEQDR
ncbi:hypothetical protein Z945_178 [Sulfitobacter noctilucae]|nr:hypothetical protein Z945_178 [Sulfitobacter noctilucae]